MEIIEIKERGINEVSEHDFRKIAVESVVTYFNTHLDSSDSNKQISSEDVYVVWMCKVLQNNKCLLSTTVPDGVYYEFTWNGDKAEGYLDVYKKWENLVVRGDS